MDSWTYSGGYRINKAVPVKGTLLMASMYWQDGEWRWSCTSVKADGLKEYGGGRRPTFVSALEACTAYMEMLSAFLDTIEE